MVREVGRPLQAQAQVQGVLEAVRWDMRVSGQGNRKRGEEMKILCFVMALLLADKFLAVIAKFFSEEF